MRNLVITGGVTGIGYAIAKTFVAAGDAVVITGRRGEVLHAAAERLGARPARFDASDPAVERGDREVVAHLLTADADDVAELARAADLHVEIVPV
jgi:NAD(P)-dependent dehydrogenase (short-subunit alcohol dehydrogenase family)